MSTWSVLIIATGELDVVASRIDALQAIANAVTCDIRELHVEGRPERGSEVVHLNGAHVGSFWPGDALEVDEAAQVLTMAPGFYWARVGSDSGRWQPVEVTYNHGRRFVAIIGDEGSAFEPIEWGPKLETPDEDVK